MEEHGRDERGQQRGPSEPCIGQCTSLKTRPDDARSERRQQSERHPEERRRQRIEERIWPVLQNGAVGICTRQECPRSEIQLLRVPGIGWDAGVAEQQERSGISTAGKNERRFGNPRHGASGPLPRRLALARRTPAGPANIRGCPFASSVSSSLCSHVARPARSGPGRTPGPSVECGTRVPHPSEQV